MQACMDSSADWLKGIVHEEIGMDSSSSPSTELIACSRPPVLERRLRPQHDQALQCPRCDSTHTKFCYYNNYSLSQPRYFCKTCRRYWTKGGSLRNVPVGGGCRKNKRPGNKKPSDRPAPFNPNQPISCFQGSTTDLHLAFSGVHLPNHESFPESPRNLNFMECKYNSLLGSSVGGLELMESKFGGAPGSSRSNLFMGGSGIDMCLGVDANPNHGFASTGSFHGFNQLGFPIDGSHGTLMEACQRLSLPFEGQEEEPSAIEAKPVDRILSLDWQDHGCAEVGRDSFGYSNGLGLWTGMINGHGPSAAI